MKPTAKFQIVLVDEASIPKMFSKKNLADTKKFLERSETIAEVKFKDPVRMYKGASVFITTNSDPLADLDFLF